MVLFESITPIELAIMSLMIIIIVLLGYLIYQLVAFRPKLPFWKYGLWPYSGYSYFHRRYLEELYYIIQIAEREAGIQLTPGAQEMLAIPVIESIESEGSVDWREVEGSVSSLVRGIAEDKSIESRKPNSIALIKSFAKNFCNIPPFCSRKER